MRKRNSIRDRRQKARQMDPWETDEHEQYAGNMPVVDPIFVLGLIPLLGVLYALTMMFTGYTMGTSSTGVPQQAIRSGHIGLVAQAMWVIVLGIMVVV